MFYGALAKKSNSKQALRMLILAEKKLNTAVLSITNYEAMYQVNI